MFRLGNFGVKSVKLMYFFKDLFFHLGAWLRQTKCILMMTKEGSTKFVQFMTTGAGVLVLGRGHLYHLVKCIISLKIFFSNTRHRSDKLVYSNDDQRRVYQNCKFFDPQCSCAGA